MKLLRKLLSIVMLTLTAVPAIITTSAAEMPAMQRPVTISLWSLPLHTALSKISAATGVHLMAASDLMHYRISVAVHDQPLLNVMNEIVDLFGHGTIPYHDYGWAHVNKPDGYLLERNGEAIQQEQDMLKYPAREMAHQLREIVQFIRMSPQQRLQTKHTDCDWIQYVQRNFEGHLPHDTAVTTDALRVITDSQLQTLIDTGQVEVDQCHPSLTAMKQLQLDTRKSPFDPPNTAIRASQFSKPVLSFNTYANEKLFVGRGSFELGLDYEVGPWLNANSVIEIDPLQVRYPLHIKKSKAPGQTFNIRPSHPAPPVIRSTCQNALKQLSKVTNMQIISEAFITEPLVIQKTTGTAENLLDSICLSTSCTWRKVGNTYLVYSRSWAQDRQADIPQHLLQAWNQSISEHGYVTLHVLGQMSRLDSWQMPTITYSTGYQLLHRRVFHFLDTLSSPDLQESSQPTGFTYYPTRLATNLLDKINPGELTVPPYNIKTRVIYDPGKTTPDHATVIIVDSVGKVLAAIREPLTNFLKYEDDLAEPTHTSAGTG